MDAGAVGRIAGIAAGGADNVAAAVDDVAEAAGSVGTSFDDAVAHSVLARQLDGTRLHEKSTVIGDEIARSEPIGGSGLSEYFLSHADDGVADSILAGHRTIMERFTEQFGAGTSTALADAGRAALAATDDAAGVVHTKTIVIDDAARRLLDLPGGWRPDLRYLGDTLDGPIVGQEAFREQFAESFRRMVDGHIIRNVRS